MSLVVLGEHPHRLPVGVFFEMYGDVWYCFTVQVGVRRPLPGHFPVVRELSTDVTRKGTPTEIVTLSVKDWFTLLGIIVPVLILCIFGWLRHDRLLTEVVTNQKTLTDRLERVETTLDAGIRP
jgi:hypothetical protein